MERVGIKAEYKVGHSRMVMGRIEGSKNVRYFQGEKAVKKISLRVSEKLLRQFDEKAAENGQKRSEALFSCMLRYIREE